MRFKPGQEVVCVTDKLWWNSLTNTPCIGPKKNELVTIRFYDSDLVGVSITGYPRNYFYHEENFEPVVNIDELKMILETESIEA